MKVWVVSHGDSLFAENIGVHQLEDFAFNQANEEMAIGEWEDPYIHISDGTDEDVRYIKATTWLRGDDFVSIEEFEVKY